MVSLVVYACSYSPNELRYLPLNTALYEPPLDPELPGLDSDGDSDDAEEGKGEDGKKTKGSSVRVSTCGCLLAVLFHTVNADQKCLIFS